MLRNSSVLFSFFLGFLLVLIFPLIVAAQAPPFPVFPNSHLWTESYPAPRGPAVESPVRPNPRIHKSHLEKAESIIYTAVYLVDSYVTQSDIGNWYLKELPKYGWKLKNKKVEHHDIGIISAGNDDHTSWAMIFEKGVIPQDYKTLNITVVWQGPGFWEGVNLPPNKPAILITYFAQSLTSPLPYEEENGEDEGPPEEEEICQYSLEEEARRQEILARLKEKYRFSVLDSNLCGQETCGSNSPWSEAELLEMKATFEQLPACFTDRLALGQIRGRQGGELLFSSVWEQRCCETKDGEVLETQSGDFAGYLSLEEKITICDRWFKERGKTLEELLTHEMTHAFQQGGAITVPRLPTGPYTNPVVISWLKETGWSPDGICLPVIGCPGTTMGVPPDLPSDYARKTKSPLEDMAESIRLYVTNPEELLSVSPRRYNFIRGNILCGKEYRE